MSLSEHVSQDAIFIGANRQPQVSDCVPNLVAFGAKNNVALWNPVASDRKGVYHTLKHGDGDVTCVKFVPNSDFLLSAGEDGRLNLFAKVNDSPTLFSGQDSVMLEKASIVCMAVVDDVTFVTGNTLGDVVIWQISGAQLEAKHTFRVKFNFYPTSLALEKIGQRYLLVVGGTSCDLHVYSFDPEVSGLESCAVLTGHEDWTKCLAFVTEKEGSSYILASGSQDRYIRLWRLRLNEAIDDSDEDDLKLILLSNKQYKFPFGDGRAAFSFDALIMGHDDWVTGLLWHPSYSRFSKGNEKKLQLLSLSADTALMIWEMDEESGIWVCGSRLGELSIKGASTATGASGGFWSCLWFEDAEDGSHHILANGKTGALRQYQSKDSEHKSWESVLGVTGAISEITDVVWSVDGSFFYVTSLDQTTRLYGPWALNRPETSHKLLTWHEFSRAQIHGYDMICLDNLSATKFVSGGDEKILRVFEMTQSINNVLHKFCGVNSCLEAGETLPEAASLPVLGLSNKAANEQLEAGEAAQREEDYARDKKETEVKDDVLAVLSGPPLEDHLQRHTLFPEIEKLYGHGYEITCCATSPDGKLIASACRSNSAKHAVVRIFNAQKDYQLVDEVLKGHNLTITSLEFSADGRYLVVVSRDRQMSLWKVKNELEGTFDLVDINPKAHTRIIWDCSWAPQENGMCHFVTCSRDKSIKLWEVKDSAVACVATTKTEDAVTSVACFQQGLINKNYVIAIGHENGQVSLFAVQTDAEEKAFRQIIAFDEQILPAGRVSKVAFSKKCIDGKMQLAVGSHDTSVRLFSINRDIV